jgi:hypothetical protein
MVQFMDNHRGMEGNFEWTSINLLLCEPLSLCGKSVFFGKRKQEVS